ncbi:MAG: endonuclease [Brevundimonas sp.]|nr:endonuclease [Brevundimonas sp.]
MGSSINLSVRLSSYFTKSSLLGNITIIYRALLKYGHSNFMLIILECCDKEAVRLKETKYIKDLNPAYNILRIAGSSLGYAHTAETLAKLRVT